MYGISDTGATQNYIKVDTPCENKVNTTQGPQVLLPYGSLMQAIHRAELNIRPLFSTRSKTSHIFSHLQSGSLISVGKICGDGCTAIFTVTHITVEKIVDIVLEGT